LSISLSASVALPGIPRFYKKNVQGSNKKPSVIPNFYPPGWETTKKGLYIAQNEKSGQSEVEYTLLGVKREESKSILLENVFIYGVDTSVWNVATNFFPTYNFYTYGYCSILNTNRSTPRPSRESTYLKGYLVRNKRLQGVQLLANTLDAVFDPDTPVQAKNAATVKLSDLTGYTNAYYYPVIYHDAKRSCVSMEGWLEPSVTPWWYDFQGEFCQTQVGTSPFDATLTLETSRAFRYEPGKAIVFTMGIKANLDGGVGILNGNIVNSRAMWGARNDTDTYRFVLEGNGAFYVERVTPYAETYMRVDRKNFYDPLDGTGESGLNIDFSKVTMYSIEFSWYGAVGANFFVYVPIKGGDSKWIKIASLTSSNKYTRPALSSPNMRLFTEIYIPMGCSKPQALSIYGSSVYIDGNYRDTLKYYTNSVLGIPIEQRPKTYVTLEVPNFIDGAVNKPRNNANVFPHRLNGISTADTQIELYESTNGGSPDITTAYRETSLPSQTQDLFALVSDVLNNNSRNIVVSALDMNEFEKIDFMKRAVNTFLTITTPVTTYQPFLNAGNGKTYGNSFTYDIKIQSLSSRANDNRINIILDSPIYPPFSYYGSTNTSNINLRNSVSVTYPVITSFPSVPSNSILYSPNLMPNKQAIFLMNTNVRNNRSFLVTKKAIKKGTFSFDTDISTQSYGSVGFFATYGIISQSQYEVIKNNNGFLDEINTNNLTTVQTVSTSPINEFLNNSEYYFDWRYGKGGVGIWPPSYGFPLVLPFWNGSNWVYNEIPGSSSPYSYYGTSTTNPLIQGIRNKKDVSTLLDEGSFTLNVDIRDHNFYFYGSQAQIVSGPNSNYTYVRVKLSSKDLFSLEDEILTNNLYNFKLLIYGHNGQMFDCLANRTIYSPAGNWNEPNAILQPLIFGYGTTYSMIDAALDEGGSILYTVAFPKSSTQAINAFISKPNVALRFKTVFLRNTQYRSPASINYYERNAGLWYGTFFISTVEPVHLFVFLHSKVKSANNWPQQLMQSTDPISRPMLTNLQLYNATEENNVILPETPSVDSYNTTLVTTLTSTVNGVLDNLPLVNFNMEKIVGVNTYVDSSTSQVLNTREKIKRFTFSVNKNIPFTYDLTSIYGSGKYILNSQATSILNRDFKRFFVAARTTKDESFGTPWTFSVNGQVPNVKTPFAILNPIGTAIDAARFYIDTTKSGKNVYLQNVLKTPSISDAYYIWSIYAKPLTPALSGRFVIFELKTGESNASQAWRTVAFDIIDNKIGFFNCASQNLPSIPNSTCSWKNNYDNIIKSNLGSTANLAANLAADTNWFPATASRAGYSNIKGYANLANKNNTRYVVAAHIEDVGDGWKRLSTCTYYGNNHTDNIVYIGNYTSTLNTRANISLWGFKEEIVPLQTTVDVLSGWYPSPYNPIGTGLISLNLTTGEQL